MMTRKMVRIVYHENPELVLDIAVYDADSLSYQIKYIHPAHHAEVDSVDDLRSGIQFEEPTHIKEWQDFMNALYMLPDQYIRSLDVIVLTRAGEVIEEES
jgi:hypothetical protein